MPTLACEVCGTWFQGRILAKTCGTKCRSIRYRRNKGIGVYPESIPVAITSSATPIPGIDVIPPSGEPLPFTRPSRPLTSDDRDEVNYILQDAEEWFERFEYEPTSCLALTLDSPEDPMSQEQVDLLVEKLQMREDIAYIGGPDYAFVYNKRAS